LSTLHATLNTCNPVEMTRVRSPLEALNALRTAATTFAARLGAGIRHRWTMRTLDRFSDRRLRDLGFERDWDGTVIPIVDGQ
jgi:hypothetical protein